MQGSLWVLGLGTAAVGFVAIGFGIAPSALNFGDTLIMAGTTAVVGGFILIGLATVVGQLKRIADLGLADSRTQLPAEPLDPRTNFLNSQISQGLAPATPSAPRAAAPEPKPAVVTPASESESVAWLRAKGKEPTLGERAVIEEFEASLAPLSAPTSPPPAPSPRPAPVTNLPRIPDPKGWPPTAAGEPAAQSNAPRTAPDRTSSGVFDAVWPEIRPARSAEAVERVRKSEPPPPSREPVKGTGEFQEAQPTPPEESRAVAILKSGMIDGMAYTLFADGSIEAVLPTGTLRFASVDALRLHLEKNG